MYIAPEVIVEQIVKEEEKVKYSDKELLLVAQNQLQNENNNSVIASIGNSTETQGNIGFT